VGFRRSESEKNIPMSEKRRWVLIGDPAPGRFDLLRGLLDDEFMASAEHVGNFDDFREKCKERRWNLLLIAHDLPRSPAVKNPFLFKYFAHLDFELNDINKGCIVDTTAPAELEGIDPRPISIHVPSGSPTQAELDRIVTELGSLLPRAPRLPELVPVDSPSLREQIRSLADGRNLDEGKTVLRRLLRDLFLCERVQISKLGQGASGAKVFRVQPETDDDSREFILKLSSGADLWKILLELKRHAEARATLGVDGYLVHFAQLVNAELPYEYQGRSLEHVVYYKNWYAIGYDFLGGKRFGKLIDLETVVVSSATSLEEKTEGTEFSTPASDLSASRRRRVELFSTTLDWLCRNWYMKDGLIKRELREVWKSEDAPDKQYPTMPPYQLATKSKGFVLNFIDSDTSRIGTRFFEDWEEHRQRVWELVEKTGERIGTAFLDRHLPFILSPAHGDLNANNILLWLDQSCHPFLIDFPFYQQEGHALQDFARLEIEIKLSLMDRQDDSPFDALPALDHTFSQMPLWKEMEDHLLSADWQSPKSVWAAAGYSDNVDFCLGLIQLLRSKAVEVQQQMAGPDVGGFMDEYGPALLYHTVRAIGYHTLPVFKRLLAVYSASRLLAA
jgi:hypothetical protein